MDFLWDAITEWLKELLVGGITSNLSGMFDSVNQKVAEISGQVGMTPQGWNGSIYNMIHNLSETVIVPIAGAILAFVMTLELIQIITDKNNFHEIETAVFFKWIFKTACAILIVTNTWNIVMGVFDVAQGVVNQASGVIISDASIDISSVILMLPFFLLAMYEKNGQPLEKILRNMIRVCFLRPRQRPYKTKNFYAVIMRQNQLDREVYHIVNGKAPALPHHIAPDLTVRPHIHETEHQLISATTEHIPHTPYTAEEFTRRKFRRNYQWVCSPYHPLPPHHARQLTERLYPLFQRRHIRLEVLTLIVVQRILEIIMYATLVQLMQIGHDGTRVFRPEDYYPTAAE